MNFKLTCQDAFGRQLHHGNQPPPRTRQGRAAARGVGGLAWEGKWGEERLKGPVAAVGTGTMGPGPAGLGWGRLSGARTGAGARRSARWGSAQGLRRRPWRCERGDAAPVPSPASAVGSEKCDPASLQPQPKHSARGAPAHLPPACPASSSSPLTRDWLPPKAPAPKALGGQWEEGAGLTGLP